GALLPFTVACERPHQHAEAAHPALRLRLCSERSRRQRRGDACEEFAPRRHSITSSARARIDGGTVRPSVFAVLRLTTSSNVVGCWTGRSAGLAPLTALAGEN